MTIVSFPFSINCQFLADKCFLIYRDWGCQGIFEIIKWSFNFNIFIYDYFQWLSHFCLFSFYLTYSTLRLVLNTLVNLIYFGVWNIFYFLLSFPTILASITCLLSSFDSLDWFFRFILFYHSFLVIGRSLSYSIISFFILLSDLD